MAVLLLGFFADIVLQLLDPFFTFFPVSSQWLYLLNVDREKHLLCRIKHIVEHNAAARHVDIDGKRLCLSLWFEYLSFGGAVGGLISSCQLSHQGVSAIIVKVDTGDISIVQGTGASTLFGVPGSGSVKVGCLWAASPRT